MNERPRMPASRRWLRLLLRFYPADFRDEMGDAVVDAYLERCRRAAAHGALSLAAVWCRALIDSVRNGLGERLQPAVAWRRAGNWGRDAEIAVRRLVRAPAFSLAVIGTLTVGLGAFAVVLTVIDKTLIEPLPYERPNDLYFVWRDMSPWVDIKRAWLGSLDIAALDKAGGPILDVAAILRDRRTIAEARDGGQNPEEVAVMVSSSNLFDVLGVRPFIGRGFAPGEAGPDRSPVIVLGYDLWQRRYAGSSAIIGSGIRVNGELFTVIGVMAPDFHFVRHSSLGPPENADVYITFTNEMTATLGAAFAGLIRARPGSSPIQVGAAVAAVGKALDVRRRGIKSYAVGLQDDLVAPVRPALFVLGLSGVFFLLVLAANLAALLLARTIQRERELAVSRALGATPMVLVRATILEAGSLGALGGVGASLMAVWGTRVLVALAPLDLPRRESIAVDWRVAIAVIGIGALLGCAAGAAPAFWASRLTLGSLLRRAAVRGGGDGRLRRLLVVVQVALCLVLLTTGGLVARSFEQLLRSQPGFDPAGVLTFRVPLAQSRYSDNASVSAFYTRLEHELATVPGVLSVGAASAVPLTGNVDQARVALPGAPGNTGRPEHDSPLVDTPQARAGWFGTLGIRILAGRDFGQKRPGDVPEAIIDRTLAAEFFPAGDAVGKSVRFHTGPLTIVGVVEHARQYDLHRNGRPQLYLRDEDGTYGSLFIALRTGRSPLDLVPDVRAVVHRLDPQLTISQARTLDGVVNASLGQQRVGAVLVTGFSLGALFLAAMGLFGVVAGSVTRRRHEIAVRLALGADRARVLRLVLGEGAALVGLGVVVAVPGIYVAGKVLRGVLIGISPFDPLTIVAATVGLALVALAACYIPARRVGLIELARALRED